MKIDERIEVVAYNPEWIELYKEEVVRLSHELMPILDIQGFEHIGSTSIPGMTAKPVVDIMIGVKELSIPQKVINKLSDIGYEYFGEIGEGRIYVRKRTGKHYNLAIVMYQGNLWEDNIIFRNYLRSNPEATKEYGEIKKMVYESGSNMLLSYSEGKKDHIINLLIIAKTVVNKENR